MKNKIYIAGKMQGVKEFNFPAFFLAEIALCKQGFSVFNPARADNIDTTGMAGDLAEIPSFCIREAMKRNCAAIADCDAIYMLDGWRESGGAKLELQLAEYLELDVIYEAV